VAPELDDFIRRLLLVCTSGQWRRIQEIPPAWWESLDGAPLLQALLDAEGNPALLPEGAMAAIRHLEAQASRHEEAGRNLEFLLVKLEMAYVDREWQANNRLLQDPRTMVDASLTDKIMIRQKELLGRLWDLKKLSQRRRQ
jgi:DNA primase